MKEPIELALAIFREAPVPRVERIKVHYIGIIMFIVTLWEGHPPTFRWQL
jgi:hypothetical protein